MGDEDIFEVISPWLSRAFGTSNDLNVTVKALNSNSAPVIHCIFPDSGDDCLMWGLEISYCFPDISIVSITKVTGNNVTIDILTLLFQFVLKMLTKTPRRRTARKRVMAPSMAMRRRMLRAEQDDPLRAPLADIV